MIDCSNLLKWSGKEYPELCKRCGSGPCITEKEIEESGKRYDLENAKEKFKNLEWQRNLKTEEFHAKQQYADFVKAAMAAMIANPKFSEMPYEDVAKFARKYAEATLEEMTRRGK